MRRELSRRFKRTRLISGFCQSQTNQGTSSSHFELLQSKLPNEHSIQHGLIALLGCTMMKKRILSSVSHAQRPCITKRFQLRKAMLHLQRQDSEIGRMPLTRKKAFISTNHRNTTKKRLQDCLQFLELLKETSEKSSATNTLLK